MRKLFYRVVGEEIREGERMTVYLHVGRKYFSLTNTKKIA